MEKATFAAGCFWEVEAVFRQLNGVKNTCVGYTGGFFKNPTYEEICGDKTAHAEAVEMMYNPACISFQDLLQVFWQQHNPTTHNRQGPDIGSQYRSAIFYHNEAQKEAALISKALLQQSDLYRNQPIVTEISPAGIFYKAEEYHQRYLEKRGFTACLNMTGKCLNMTGKYV